MRDCDSERGEAETCYQCLAFTFAVTHVHMLPHAHVPAHRHIHENIHTKINMRNSHLAYILLQELKWWLSGYVWQKFPCPIDLQRETYDWIGKSEAELREAEKGRREKRGEGEMQQRWKLILTSLATSLCQR